MIEKMVRIWAMDSFVNLPQDRRKKNCAEEQHIQKPPESSLEIHRLMLHEKQYRKFLI
jgi:hypothetical protein